jgi:hypothetical protein
MNRRLAFAATAALCAAFLSGCATTGATYQQASAAMPALKAGEGRVYFFRSSSMMGAALQPDVKLNGEVVGESKPGGFFFVDRPAGKYTASASTETEKTLSFSLDAGETKYVRSSVSFGIVVGRVILELEQPEKAKAELQTLRQTTLAAKK